MDDALTVAGRPDGLAGRSIVSRLRSHALGLRLDRGAGADRRAGRAGARVRGGGHRRENRQEGLQPLRHRPEQRRHAGGGQDRAGGGRAIAAEPLRLGLRQQFRQAGPADRDRTPFGPRARLQGGDAQTHRRPQDRGARRIPKRRLPDAAQRDRRSVPEEAIRGFFRVARKGGREGDPAVAHAGRIRAGALAERSGRPAGRIQRLAGGQTPANADRYRGARDGPRTYRPSDPAMGQAAARRRARAQSGNRQIRGRSFDRGSRGRLRRYSARRSAHRYGSRRPDRKRADVRRPRRRRRRRDGRAAAGNRVRPLRSQRPDRAKRRRRRAGRRGAASHARQPDRPHRLRLVARRADDQFPADQTGRHPSRERRLSAHRRAQPADRTVQLDRAQTRAAARRGRHRGRRPLPRPDQHGFARTRSHSAAGESRAVRRPPAVFPALRLRPGPRRALQDSRRFRGRPRAEPGERSDLRAAGRPRSRAATASGRSIARRPRASSSTRRASPPIPASCRCASTICARR